MKCESWRSGGISETVKEDELVERVSVLGR